MCLNPLKRVNSILTISLRNLPLTMRGESQSPQTGQFNSYHGIDDPQSNYEACLNPLKRVNSILTFTILEQKILTINFISLNPLKRVNSILTLLFLCYRI